MKKGIIAVVLLLCLSLFGCSNKIKDEDCYRIGQKFENKSIGLRLNDASFAIALENSYSSTGDRYKTNFFKPTDKNIDRNPYVAPDGYTLVYMDISLSSIGRSGVYFDDWESNDYVMVFISRVIYKDKEYQKKEITQMYLLI